MTEKEPDYNIISNNLDAMEEKETNKTYILEYDGKTEDFGRNPHIWREAQEMLEARGYRVGNRSLDGKKNTETVIMETKEEHDDALKKELEKKIKELNSPGRAGLRYE